MSFWGVAELHVLTNDGLLKAQDDFFVTFYCGHSSESLTLYSGERLVKSSICGFGEI